MLHREHEVIQRKNSMISDEFDSEHFSKFSNKTKCNGSIPSKTCIMCMHKKFHDSNKKFFLAEIKKIISNSLHWDASHKDSKRLTHCDDVPIFKGLVISTNDIGEIRMQFHVVTDAHD